jgi:flagellar biosynthesis chaperone FliJ
MPIKQVDNSALFKMMGSNPGLEAVKAEFKKLEAFIKELEKKQDEKKAEQLKSLREQLSEVVKLAKNNPAQAAALLRQIKSDPDLQKIINSVPQIASFVKALEKEIGKKTGQTASLDQLKPQAGNDMNEILASKVNGLFNNNNGGGVLV